MPSREQIQLNDKLAQLYANRFDQTDRAWKDRVWAVLWTEVFARWIKPSDVLLDIGAGYCEFINNAVAKRRIAVDLNPETKASAGSGVEVLACSAEALPALKAGDVDVAFSSNFLEHLSSKAAVSAVLDEIHRVLKPGGTVLLMGPNIRFLADRYWDYFDHHVPLSHESLREALELHGFEVRHVEPRFLPYTVKGSRLRWTWLVKAYLATRPLSSRLMGKQFFLAAIKRQTTDA